jgi:hypothetical protein
MKNMSSNQLLQLQKEKLIKQDEHIDVLVGMTKEGNNLTKQVKNELIKQNKDLEVVGEDVNNLFNYNIF